MRLLFIVNPKSGRGRAIRLAERFLAALDTSAHQVDTAVLRQVPPTDTPVSWEARLAGVDVAVIFGGDGTVHSFLTPLCASGAALYHVPMGTENLFARQFRMSDSPAVLAHALAAPRFESVDVGVAGDRKFVIMCSLGPDASVVHRLAERRTGAIRHWSYARPMFAEAFRPALGPFDVEIDGNPLIIGGKGLLLVANSAMYALGLNPARDASMHDALLDVVFLPATGAAGVVRWYAQAFASSLLATRGVMFQRGRHVVVRASGTPYQLDGDVGGIVGRPGAAEPLQLGVLPGALRVLRSA